MILATLSVVSLAAPSVAKGGPMIKIEGVVTNSAGKPQAGVTVAVDRSGAPSTVTDGFGAYRLEIAGGPPIGQLSYSHSNFDYAVVESISGEINQSISKVLYGRGEKRVASAMVDTLGAYEQLLVALIQSEQAERRQRIAVYRREKWLEAVNALPADGAGASAWLDSRKKSLSIELARQMG
ncbi:MULTISPECIES: carboxypeptidase-like regulatory domain-containing protein [unclassified Rhizobacter]|uniref:carboxypeptidase-like regulatory domain-containing protein n=1 Tax=unclassified Rhizobacter TaxID=2640088 RepID=UPI0006FC6A07|nr:MULTISPECIES: carboxypeptidase-like regulatory domain-containing protein [unclassified Rhizobacter]KQU67926.1 hypothetical protein ASC88_08180 [Rhizobacter sp. Root29]KQW15187.1 hypothetical protein ASC98_13735 [Rhizobacter sp. Root1238]KRB24351.1 hypothetical protein ASE08_17720 [Rhizobacter sp. Root16D2]